MAFTKITQQELNSRGATTLPNQPTIPAQQLKQEFDAPAKEIVAPKVNNLIDELEATSAAASIGAVAPTGRSGSTVKEVLDDMSEDLASVEGTSHSHSNKSLLDSYNQTNANLSDAVTKKHEHNNKSVLDKFSESGGKPLYDGQTIGEGDMKKSDYDSDSTVKNAGGIKAYVDARASAAYRPAGTKTVAELLPALLIEANNNNVYNITDSGLTTEYFLEGAGKPIYPGDNVGIAYVSPNTYKFDLLRGIVDLTPYAKTADLGTAAAKNTTNAVTQASTDLVESGAVYASVHAVAQDLSDTNLAVAALQTASINLGKYKAEADSIAPVELDATGASQAYAVDEQFYLVNVLMTATSPISQNDAIVVYPTSGYNCKPSDSVTEQIQAVKDGLGTASAKNSTSVVTQSTDLVESGAVKDIVGWGNKNKLPMTVARIKRLNTSGTWSGNNYTFRGIVWTILTDDANNVIGIKADQTATQNSFLDVGTVSPDVANGKTLNGCPASGSVTTYFIQATNNSNRSMNETGSGLEITDFPSSPDIRIRLTVMSDYAASNLIFYPMVRASGDATFEPYHASVEETIPQVVSDAVGWDGKNKIKSLTQGSIDTYGVLNPNIATRVSVNDFISVNGNSKYVIKSDTNVQVVVLEFTSTSTERVYQSGWMSLPYEFTAHSNVNYVKMMFRYSNDANIVPSNVVNPSMAHLTVDEQKADNSVIAPVENGTTASQAYAVGEHFIRDGAFCTVTQAISSGGEINSSNTVNKPIADCLIKQATFSGTTSASGNLSLGIDKPVLSVKINTNYMGGIVYYDNNGVAGIHVMNTDGQAVTSTNISGTYYYI